MTLYHTNFEAMLMAAHDAAAKAVKAMGPENLNALDCGFAWVSVDGQSALARYCRSRAKTLSRDAHTLRRFYGDKNYPKGHKWWCPGQFNGQAVGHHEAGAYAFRDELAKHGVVATVHSRLD